MQAFHLTDAAITDLMMSLGVSLDDEYTLAMASSVGKAMTSAIEELLLAPRLASINEGGFSISWDFENLGKYYIYLCRKWGMPINNDVLTASGISAIIDKSDMW
jgi:hypothetical protein